MLTSGLKSGIAQALRKFERTFAASNVEHRSPFWDRRLIEAAFEVSDRLKIRGRANKYVLRKALAGIVPHEFLSVPKHPQCMRYDATFAEALDALARTMLTPERVRERNLFDAASIARLSRRAPGTAYAPEAGMRIWTAVLTECWAQLFLDQQGERLRPNPRGQDEPGGGRMGSGALSGTS